MVLETKSFIIEKRNLIIFMTGERELSTEKLSILIITAQLKYDEVRILIVKIAKS